MKKAAAPVAVFSCLFLSFFHPSSFIPHPFFEVLSFTTHQSFLKRTSVKCEGAFLVVWRPPCLTLGCHRIHSLYQAIMPTPTRGPILDRSLCQTHGTGGASFGFSADYANPS